MQKQNQTVVYALKWGWRGFALEITAFVLLVGIGLGFYRVDDVTYRPFVTFFFNGAWIAAGALRLYRSLPMATAEIARMRAKISAAQAQGRMAAAQPIKPPSGQEWKIALIGVTVMLAVGLVVAYGQPPLRIRCDRVSAAHVDCQVQETMFWLVPVGEQTLLDVQTVAADADFRVERSEGLGQTGKSHYERDINLAFTTSDQMQTVIELDGALGGSFEGTAQRIRTLIADPAQVSVTAWHAPSLSTLVSLGFVFAAGLVYYSGFRQWLKTRAITKIRLSTTQKEQ